MKDPQQLLRLWKAMMGEHPKTFRTNGPPKELQDLHVSANLQPSQASLKLEYTSTSAIDSIYTITV